MNKVGCDSLSLYHALKLFYFRRRQNKNTEEGLKRKTFNVYGFKLAKRQEELVRTLSDVDLSGFLESIRRLPREITESGISRYSEAGTQEERCLIFLDEIKDHTSISTDYIPALFIKRRGGSRPFEEDGHGNLFELKLSDEENQIAEVGFVLFCIKSSLALWIYNPMVGGINLFADYLNNAFRRSCKGGLNSIPFSELGPIDDIAFHYIRYPNAESDFKSDYFKPSVLEFNIAAKNEDLSNGFLFGGSDGDEIRLIRHFIKQSNCTRFKMEIASEKPSKKKFTTGFESPILKKGFISSLYDQTIEYLRGKDGSKFIVKGKGIDEDNKVLDLINSKLIYELDISYDGATIPINDLLLRLLSLAKSKESEMGSYTS